MTLQVQEITNFKTGIDVALDPILSPIDAFVNLNNGFVYRGVLRSRAGYRHFASGDSSTTRDISRVADQIVSESQGNPGDGTSDYSFTITNGQVERGVVTITAPTEVLTVTLTYDPITGLTAATGDFGTGSNNINWQTGAINVSFGDGVGGNTNIGVGNDIEVTYNYHPDLAIMGIHEYFQTSSVRELVVIDLDFPYVFDATNNDFDRIPFAGATAPPTAAPTAFTGLTQNFFTFQNWRLNSRGAVPAAAGALRLDDVMFLTNNVDEPMVYDGTDIKRLSEIEDGAVVPRNPYREPPEGSLDRALHVLSYGERLCWLRPVINGIEYPQGVLWGPINDNSGLALDYQGSGSGLSSAVTDSSITSFKFIRDTLIVFFETDIYALEITKDPFAPFQWTKLEDERGCEPTHGATGYLGDVECPGRLGIMRTNGRRVTRVDNQIPFFTRNRIDSDLLDHVFGEEMEEDSQFWWTFADTSSIDLTFSNKVLVKNFEEENYSVYDIPISVLNKTIIGLGITWDNLQEVFGNPDPDDGDVGDFEGPVAEVIYDKWGFLGKDYRTIIGEHNGFVYVVGDSFSDGSALINSTLSSATDISGGIAAGTTTTVQTEFHTFKVDDVVQFRNVNGMTELNELGNAPEEELPTVIAVNSQSEFVVNVNSTNFTAYTDGGEVIKPINFEAEFVPFNPFRSQGKTCHLVRMDFLVTSGTGEYTIDFFENRLNQDWTSPIKRSYTFSSNQVENIDRWFSIVIDEVADFHRWKITQNRASEQVAVKSIRIYYKEGGDSNV